MNKYTVMTRTIRAYLTWYKCTKNAQYLARAKDCLKVIREMNTKEATRTMEIKL
jgi:hypothetical protein